ncbi:MAG TPA: lysine--tRNA ligase, partial [Candidatus Thermoplasmatota archaeon]|nr:lysine--tRNA ligase [Candidatus Thermoplasmatota archaeon]
EAVARLDAAQKAYLAALHGVLENAKWTGEAIHNAIYDTAKARELPGGKAFQALYESFLAKSKGPRAGFFLASLDRQFVLDRLKAAGQ